MKCLAVIIVIYGLTHYLVSCLPINYTQMYSHLFCFQHPNGICFHAQPLLPSSCKHLIPAIRSVLASILHFTSNQDLYFLLISTWRDSLPFSNFLVDDPILEYASSFDFTEFIYQ